jgi:hypothetical protein
MLTREQVTFETRVEPEYDAPEGHFAYDTEEENQEAVAWIRARLASGNDLAWCSVVVTCKPLDARLQGIEGWDALGGVSCANQADFDQLVADHAMEETALAHLNEQLDTLRAALCGEAE